MYDVLTIEDWIRRIYASQLGPDVAQRLWLEPYSYVISFSSFVGATGTASGQLAINSNADFVLLRINYEATLASVQTVSSKPVAQVRLQVTDAGSGQAFFNSAMPLETLASHAFPSRFMPYPRFLSANSSLSLALTGYAGAAETYSAVDIVFDGIRVRQYSGAMAQSAMLRG